MSRVLIGGAVLVGFADVFDRAFGNPKTPRPYPKVTPARVGQSLLPFACPHCDEPQVDAVDPRRYDRLSDADRNFSWCPRCYMRYTVVYSGVPLVDSLEPGALAATALVDRGAGQELLEAPKTMSNSGLNELGAE